MMATAPAIVAALVLSFPVLYRLLLAGAGGKPTRKPLPPGSFGLPVVGQTLGLLRALRANTAEEWLRRRAAANVLVSIGVHTHPASLTSSAPSGVVGGWGRSPAAGVVVGGGGP